MTTTFNPKLPLELASTLPSCHYQGNEDNVFKTTWQYVGPVSSLNKTGKYVTTKINNNPLLFIRDEEFIRGFHNVCRHHASTLLKGEGECNKIRCSYHGWTYDLDGSLHGVPEFKGVENFNLQDNSLKPVYVDVIGPFLFTSLTEQTTKPLQSLKHEIPNYSFIARKEYDIKCNWKVFVDNYLDGGYHVNSIHPELAANIDYKNYRNELYEDAVLQIAPAKEANNRLGNCAYYWWFHPNFMLNIYGNMMDVNYIIPTSNKSCKVIMDFYKDISVSDNESNSSIETSDRIQIEDVDICERVQEGLESDSYDTGRYSVIREGGMYLFHCLLQS